MPSKARLLNVLIASPGDAREARDIVEAALHEWNDHRGDREGVILRPRRWEVASVPILGQGDAQSIVNEQLVDDADIVLGLFMNRIGTATPRAISGTAEEIERRVVAGKPVHLYFASDRIPREADLVQVQALQDFKRDMSLRGLIASFGSLPDLRTQVVRAIDLDVRRWLDSVNTPRPWRQTHEPPTDPRLHIEYLAGDRDAFPTATFSRLRVTNRTNGAMNSVRLMAVMDRRIVDVGKCSEIGPDRPQRPAEPPPTPTPTTPTPPTPTTAAKASPCC